MEQRDISHNAPVGDAQTLLRKEEYALGMERRSRANYAAVKDVQMEPKREDCASGMGRIARQSTKNAALKDAQIKRSVEDYV